MSTTNAGSLSELQKKLQTYLARLDDLLQQDNVVTKLLAKAEAKTRVKRSHIALIVAANLSLILLYNAFLIICDVVTLILPIYGSVKAIESIGTADDSKWLTYWICYAAVGLLEFLFWPLLSFVDSHYYLVKTVFFIWCMYPSPKLNGATIMYERVIRPLFLKHQKELDHTFSLVNRTLDASKQVLASAGNAAELVKTAQAVQQAVGEPK